LPSMISKKIQAIGSGVPLREFAQNLFSLLP
jgi:hypothetical protein